MLVVPAGCWLVALRKESVDRNVPFDVIRPAIDVVALRKESVDRNRNSIRRCLMSASLSARRAWIEMRVRGHSQFLYWRRSPQGERG